VAGKIIVWITEEFNLIWRICQLTAWRIAAIRRTLTFARLKASF
jgi:hypothetical protein